MSNRPREPAYYIVDCRILGNASNATQIDSQSSVSIQASWLVIIEDNTDLLCIFRKCLNTTPLLLFSCTKLESEKLPVPLLLLFKPNFERNPKINQQDRHHHSLKECAECNSSYQSVILQHSYGKPKCGQILIKAEIKTHKKEVVEKRQKQ